MVKSGSRSKKKKSIHPIEEGEGTSLRIIYVRLSEISRWDQNPKKHDIPKLIQSIKKYGFRDAPIWDETLGALVGGNGRTFALMEMKRKGDKLPVGILREKKSGG